MELYFETGLTDFLWPPCPVKGPPRGHSPQSRELGVG